MGLFGSLGKIAGGLAGSLIPIPGVGTALGGFLGGKLGGLLDGSGNPTPNAGNPANPYSSSLVAMMRREATGDVATGSLYQSGANELRRQLGDEADATAAALEASGVRGGEAEVGAAAARANALTGGLTRLFGQATARRDAQRSELLGLDERAEERRFLRDEAARERRGGYLTSALSVAGEVLPSIIGGGGDLPKHVIKPPPTSVVK